MRGRKPCVYMLASRRNGTSYTGVMSDLVKRIWEHKHDAVAGFTHKYNVHTLVWYEVHDTMESAIAQEKAVTEWKRSRKIRGVEEVNPEWKDLYGSIC